LPNGGENNCSPAGWLLRYRLAYLGCALCCRAFWRCAGRCRQVDHSANVYALSLAVYCTSWTFYGSVGRATSGGLSFLTIYIGPTLMLLCVGVILKMIRISKAQRITSIADFIASRYGKSQLLAGLVTVIAVIGVVPYMRCN
jgi:Na+/proline symporter